jgi:hypothetical protein
MHEKRAPLWLKSAAIAVLAAHLALVIAVIVVYANRTPTGRLCLSCYAALSSARRYECRRADRDDLPVHN